MKKAMHYAAAVMLLALLFAQAAYISFAGERGEAALASGNGFSGHTEEAGVSVWAGGNYTAGGEYQVWNTFFGVLDAELSGQLGWLCLVLPKEAAGAEIEIEEQPLQASLRVILPDCEDFLGKSPLIYVRGGECYEADTEKTVDLSAHGKRAADAAGEAEKAGAPIQGMMQEELPEGGGSALLLELDTVYEPFLYENETYYFISLKRPAELYEKIVVLDAGHGGNDPGTRSPDYAYTEKDTNLAVIRYIKELLDMRDDIRVYYTRTEDVKPSLEQRVGLANALEADLFISVHCNYNETRSVHGTEVLYNGGQDGRKPLDSKRLAEICLEKAAAGLGISRRLVIDRKENVHIIGHAAMPVALIELGYMSNMADLNALVGEETRRSAAAAICEAIDQAFREIAEAENAS